MNQVALNLKYKIIERIVPSHNERLNFVVMRDVIRYRIVKQ